MKRATKILIIATALLVGVFAILVLAGPSILRSYLYPKPHDLPQVVGPGTEQLLSRLQAVLETNAPGVAKSLQPGLSDSQISALEKEGEFRLSDSMKSLYRWRNGMPTNNLSCLVPGQRFLPLEEIARERALARQQLSSATTVQRVGYRIFAGHRQNWVHVLDDGAGDGYFYDPERKDAEGAFFYHMAEAAYYVWFPSLNNFLSGLIECYETGAFRLSADGKDLKEDSSQAQKIWERLGKSNDPGS